MKRVLAMALTCCMLLMVLGGNLCFATAASSTTYAVDALSFTAGYASAANGEIDLSAVQVYDAFDTHDLQYTDTYTELSSATGIPYQVFDVDLEGKTSGELTLHYSGATKEGERIAVKVYNTQTKAWDTVGSFKGTGRVSAAVDIATYNDQGVVHVAAMLDYVTNGANTMIWSTDPQHYTKFEDLHEYYYTIYQYAAKEYVAGNVGYIFTTGDLVDDVPGTVQAPYQWGIADRAMSYVEAVGMPNGLVSGNHDVKTFNALDYSAGDATVDYSLFEQTFPASRYEQERWYGGSLNNNISHYDLITVGNVDFIVLFLGYGVEATDETIAWANHVLKTYAHRTAIVATHEYLDAQNAEYANRGQLIYNTIVDPNPNVKMVVCGHDDGSVCRETVASDGRVVYELLADYQFVEAEEPSFYANEHWIGKVPGCCGDGYIRLLTVNGDTLSSITYSPVTGRYNPYGDIENISIDLDCGTPDRAMATAVFSAAILGDATASTTVDRLTVTTDENGTTYSAVTYATVPNAPTAVDTTAWPATTYGVAATPSNPYYAHAAKEAPAVKFKEDILQVCDLGAHPVSNGISHIGNYSLNMKVDLNRTPYLYYSFAQPADSKFTFALINDTTNSPWITFLDARLGGATLAYGADNWDNAGDAQYFTTGVTGCIDMRTMVSVAGATDWTVTQLNLFSMAGKDVIVSYLFFGSEPVDVIGSSYGEAATPATSAAPHAALDAPAVEHKANLLHAVNLNENAIIWNSVNYGNNALGYQVDLNKTPYLYYSFAQDAGSQFTLALTNENTNVPWLTFLDSRNGGTTFNTGNANWDAAGGAQFFTNSMTGCIDMRQFQYDKNAQSWTVQQVNFYNPNEVPVMVNYLFFGSAAIGGNTADLDALDALIAEANTLSTDGMTTQSANTFKSARTAAACVDRGDTSAVARTYTNLASAMGALTAVTTTEVDPSGLVSVKNYTMSPSAWLCGSTLKASTAAESYVTTESTATGMRIRRSSVSPHTWPNLIDDTAYTVKPYGGVYLKLDADMDTAWTIALNIQQDGHEETRVRLNAGIINAFHSEQADGYYGVYQNVYDISDVFELYGLDPTATFKVTGTSLVTVGSGSGWCYYNHLELMTGAATSANYYELEDTIAYANRLTQWMYTTDSWSAMQSALATANTAMSTVGLSQPQINAALHPLQTALDNLVLASSYEPNGSLLADDTAAWRVNQNLAAVSRNANGDTVVENTNGSWSSADHLFTSPRRISVKDHQLEVTMSVVGNTNILLLADGEWITISQYLTANRNGDDILAGDYTLKVPLTQIFGDRPTVVLGGVRVWSVGDIGSNAVNIHRMLIDDLDTYTFDNTLTEYGVAATPDAPFYTHAAKNGPTVTHKVDVLAACGLDHPTVNTNTSYGMQEMHLTVDLAKTPYLYYSIVQADTSRSTFSFHNDNTYAPFLTFIDANLGGATMNTGTATWDAYTDNSQYVSGSITGCIDMRTLLKDASHTAWLINNVTFYTLAGSEATYSYLYFGSAPLDNGYEEDPVTLGDVDFDGTISTIDARMVLMAALDCLDKPFTALQYTAADYNQDGQLNTADARDILKKSISR